MPIDVNGAQKVRNGFVFQQILMSKKWVANYVFPWALYPDLLYSKSLHSLSLGIISLSHSIICEFGIKRFSGFYSVNSVRYRQEFGLKSIYGSFYILKKIIINKYVFFFHKR